MQKRKHELEMSSNFFSSNPGNWGSCKTTPCALTTSKAPHPHPSQGLCKWHLSLSCSPCSPAGEALGRRLRTCPLPGVVNRGCRSYRLRQNYLINTSEVGWHQWSVKYQTNSPPRFSELHLTAPSSASLWWTCPNSHFAYSTLRKGKIIKRLKVKMTKAWWHCSNHQLLPIRTTKQMSNESKYLTSMWTHNFSIVSACFSQNRHTADTGCSSQSDQSLC